MNWRVFVQHRLQEPGVGELTGLGSAEPNLNDPYAEKRRRAVELLGERYVLHRAMALHRWSSGAGSARGMRIAPH